MKYSLNPFKWLSYLINRIRYRHSRWLHYYASVPYSKRYIRKQLRELIQDTLNELPQNFFKNALLYCDEFKAYCGEYSHVDISDLLREFEDKSGDLRHLRICAETGQWP